jgi:hypothetical protein
MVQALCRLDSVWDWPLRREADGSPAKQTSFIITLSRSVFFETSRGKSS